VEQHRSNLEGVSYFYRILCYYWVLFSIIQLAWF